MELTRETDYALRALCALARRPRGSTVPVQEVAEAEELPRSFLAKIFQKLARHGILQSSRGAGHGYALAAAPEAISVLRIVEAIQGPAYLDQCMFWRERCSGVNPCLLHERFLTVKPVIRAMLEGTTLADLARAAAGR